MERASFMRHALAMVASCGFVMAAGAAEYSVSTIAIGGGKFEKLGTFTDLRSPNINNSGQVVFVGKLDGGRTNEPLEGVFFYDRGKIKILQDTSGEFDSFDDAISINDSGAYAFSALGKGGKRGVYRGEGESVTTISTRTATLTGHGLAFNSLDANGVVVFSAFESGVKAIFSGDDGSLTRIASVGEAAYDSLRNPTTNAAGQILFVSKKDDVVSVNVSDGESVKMLYKTGALIVRIDSGGAINKSGVVSFRGVNKDVAGIFGGDGSDLQTFANESDFACPLKDPESINASNTVVFWVSFCEVGGGRLMAGSDPRSDSVIKNGDWVAGKPVTGRGPAPQINDSGQVVFFASIGESFGLFLATPKLLTE